MPEMWPSSTWNGLEALSSEAGGISRGNRGGWRACLSAPSPFFILYIAGCCLSHQQTRGFFSRLTLSSVAVVSLMATEHLKCGCFKLRFTASVKYTPSIEDLVPKKGKTPRTFLCGLHVEIITFLIYWVKLLKLISSLVEMQRALYFY